MFMVINTTNCLADKLAKSILYDDETEKLIQKINDSTQAPIRTPPQHRDAIGLLNLARQQILDIQNERKYNENNPNITTHQPGDLVLIT